MSARRIAAAVLVAAALAGCGDDANSNETLAPLPSAGGEAPNGSTPTTMPNNVTTPGTITDPAGSLAVAIGVRLSSQPIDEDLTLDLAQVSAADVSDAISAECTLVESSGTDENVVKVADFRRVQTGGQLLVASLQFGPVEPGGTTDATLTLGDAEQHSSEYAGSVTLGADGTTGTFEASDPTGATASGSFACSPNGPVAITTTTGETLPPVTEPSVPVTEAVPATTVATPGATTVGTTTSAPPTASPATTG